MRADVTKIFCALGDGTYGMELWRVDYTDIEGQTDYWLTFGAFITRASMLGARVEWHNMKKSCEQCKRRNAQAGHPVDDMEIERLAHEFAVWLEH